MALVLVVAHARPPGVGDDDGDAVADDDADDAATEVQTIIRSVTKR